MDYSLIITVSVIGVIGIFGLATFLRWVDRKMHAEQYAKLEKNAKQDSEDKDKNK